MKKVQYYKEFTFKNIKSISNRSASAYSITLVAILKNKELRSKESDILLNVYVPRYPKNKYMGLDIS